MKKLIVFLVMIFVLASSGSAQYKKFSYKVNFELGSAKVSQRDAQILSQLSDSLKEYDYLVPTFKVSTDYHKFSTTNDAKNGGLKNERVTTVGRAMGLKEVFLKDVSFSTSLNLRQVLVVLKPDLQKILAMEQKKETATRIKADSALDTEIKANSQKLTSHDSEIDSLKRRMTGLENKKPEKTNFYRFELGTGLVGVRYSDISWKKMPTLKMVWNLSQFFGIQTEGGTVPSLDFNQEKTWDAVLNSALFVKPISWLKILAGYSLATNFYEKDFAIAEDRDDAFLTGIEINFDMSEKINAYVSACYVKSDVDGFCTSVGVSYKFWK